MVRYSVVEDLRFKKKDLEKFALSQDCKEPCKNDGRLSIDEWLEKMGILEFDENDEEE